MKSKVILRVSTAIIALVSVVYLFSFSPADSKSSADSKSQDPTAAVAERDVYYPGTEELAPDEMRVVALGTGMPNARPKQAAASFLVELGNGEKFIFDAGTGSSERLSAMMIPYDYLDKVFVGHLHADHIGDLDAIWVGGVLANRQKPLRLWGPSGPEPDLGTKYMAERMVEMYKWDAKSRLGNVNTVGFKLEINEFDYKGINKLIYNENGVEIYSIPAVHALDGSVSFILKWNGLKFAFSSDTYPNKWWIEYTKGSDLAIHECFLPPVQMVTKQKFPPADGLNVATQVHTSPSMFGKVMSEMQPRKAVAYHVFNDFDTNPVITKEVRRTYDGDFDLAVDYMVWNVTKDKITTRMASINEDIWPMPSTTEKLPANPDDKYGFSDFITSGRVVYKDVIDAYYKEVNEIFGTNIPTPN